MKKSIKSLHLFLAVSLSIGLVTTATAQREAKSQGAGNIDRGSSSRRIEQRGDGNSTGRSNEITRRPVRQPAVAQPRSADNGGFNRNSRVEAKRRPLVTTQPGSVDNGSFDRNNRPGFDQPTTQRNNSGNTNINGNIEQRSDRNRNPIDRNNGNNNLQQRNGRDDVSRDYRGGGSNYNNQRYRSYRPYEPRRYVYVGAPRYSILPRTSIHIQYGGYPYYYDNGLFFNYYGGFYQPVFAPRGIRVSVLPFGYMPLYLGTNTYYYYNGTYYRPQNDNDYEVVDAPMGAQVSAMPKGTKAVSVNGEKFYEFNGTYYKEDRNEKGKVVYTVVGKNGEIDNTENAGPASPVTTFKEGEVISQLPEGSKTVTINGQQLFVSPDDIYFKLQVDGNNINYRVVGTPSDDKSPVNYEKL